MSDLLDQRVTEWGLWYMEHKDLIPEKDVLKQNEFLRKALMGVIECLSIATKDIQELERRDPRKQLWLPKGMAMQGSMKHFG